MLSKTVLPMQVEVLHKNLMMLNIILKSKLLVVSFFVAVVVPDIKKRQHALVILTKFKVRAGVLFLVKSRG